MDSSLFDDVTDALRGLVPAQLGTLHQQPRRYGLKVWLTDPGGQRGGPPREHYEAQVIGARLVEGATVLALEVGFHSEYPKVVDNDAVLARLGRHERRWRKVLGSEAVVGAFLGRPDPWRRISETWPDPDLSEPGLAIEIALRLTDYITALEPSRTT